MREDETQYALHSTHPALLLTHCCQPQISKLPTEVAENFQSWQGLLIRVVQNEKSPE